VELLDSHDDLAVFGEVFGGARVRADYGAEGVPRFETYLERQTIGRRLPLVVNRLSYLRKLYAARPDAKAVGFKLVYGHARRGSFEYFAMRRVRVLHLVRANVFDAVLSYEVGKARGFVGARREETLRPVTVTLNPSTLRKRLEDHEYAISYARHQIHRYRLPWLEVFYEELVARRDEMLRRILGFLDVEPSIEGLHSTFVPIDDVPRADVVENLDEVRDVLAGTRFEWMLGDPRGAAARATG
jgi:hypothetical protein